MTLEKTFDKDEFIISLLKEIKEKQGLQQKQNAWILSKLKRSMKKWILFWTESRETGPKAMRLQLEERGAG